MNDHEYKKRHIEWMENIAIDSWSVKLYRITKQESSRSMKRNDGFTQLLKQNVNQADQEGHSYNVAFVIVHEASEAIFTLINWWVEGNMLITKMYISSFESPEDYEEITNSNRAGACIWELAVISYERNAWVTDVLQHKGAIDHGIKTYLEKQYIDYI
ncbi:hypothetical protein [Alkalicoccobacillus gibsonii]|uniref:hypothetical protein n=1 Tax=Alkalicoccobacillus gibsonii TaxID=79881 RepID=UPI0035112840